MRELWPFWITWAILIALTVRDNWKERGKPKTRSEWIDLFFPSL